MAKRPMKREKAIELTGKFMLLDGMDTLDFFVCGSIRRGKDDVGDIDLIVVGDYPTPDKECEKFFESGGSKARTYSYYGRQINMWKTTPDLLGAAVLYATGSGTFNRRIRMICQRQGMKLSQNGLSDRESGKILAGETEKQIFNKMGLKYIPPSYRDTNKMAATITAFTLRFKTDQSYVERLMGRVFNRDLYSEMQQEMLPLHIPFFNIKEGLENAQRLAGDRDA
jgi:DNA polymerase/3'-5' exonuclease PolX